MTQGDKSFYPHFLPGRGTRSGNASRNAITHAVRRAHGDNFNAAACGVTPTGKSLGWIEVSRPVSCTACNPPATASATETKDGQN